MGYQEVAVPESRVVVVEGIYALNVRLRPLVRAQQAGRQCGGRWIYSGAKVVHLAPLQHAAGGTDRGV